MPSTAARLPRNLRTTPERSRIRPNDDTVNTSKGFPCLTAAAVTRPPVARFAPRSVQRLAFAGAPIRGRLVLPECLINPIKVRIFKPTGPPVITSQRIQADFDKLQIITKNYKIS
jgi:hypothetical protein